MPGVEYGGAWIRAFVEQARAATHRRVSSHPVGWAGTRPKEE